MTNMKPETREIYPELKKIENDIQVLKVLLMKSQRIPRKTIRLKGALKKVRIEEEDIGEAKKSVFSQAATQ